MLTKEDISYLKRADDVYAINIDGQNFLRVIKRADWRDRFSDDKRVDIAVDGNGASGFFCSAWHFPWHTLRVGQTVRFDWFPGALMSDNLRAVGYVGDELSVDIGSASGKNSARYLVETYVGPDNSARMCKKS